MAEVLRTAVSQPTWKQLPRHCDMAMGQSALCFGLTHHNALWVGLIASGCDKSLHGAGVTGCWCSGLLDFYCLEFAAYHDQ